MRRDFAWVLALPLLLSACGGTTETGKENRAPKGSSAALRIPMPREREVNAQRRTFSLDEQSLRRANIVERDDEETGPSAKMAVQAVVPCDLKQYVQLDGAALVKYIQDAGVSCVRGFLKHGPADSLGAFTKVKMISVADATSALAQTYAGQDLDDLEALYGYLRVGYDVANQWSSSVDWRDPVAKTYDAQVVTATRRALDGLVANVHFLDPTAANGKVLVELFTLVDSSETNGSYLAAVKAWLRRWDPTCAAIPELRRVVGNLFAILQHGQRIADYGAAVANDTELVELLSAFVDMTWMNRTDAGTLVADAGTELGRLLSYKTAPIYPVIQQKVRSFLSRYQLLDPQYLVVARGAAGFDDCALYGVCTYRTDALAKLLVVDHYCNSSIHIRAQDMTPEQVAQSCNTLQAEESYFHAKLKTGNVPVAGDINPTLEIIVFDDSRAYQIYAYVLYDIPTDNGGYYVEGEVAGDQARFYCYEKETLRPKFVIWNLEHEYIHYLDGRYNMWGGWYDCGADTGGKVIWWIEGLAEYLSKKDYYDLAITYARTKQYPLSEIFNNDYESGSARVYRWGYLAVRFMYERHPEIVEQVLQFYRAGRYTDYLTWLNGLSTQLDAEWFGWLEKVLSLPEGTATLLESSKTYTVSGVKDSSTMYYIDLPSNVSRLVVDTDNGRGDLDLYVKIDNLATTTTFDCSSNRRGTDEKCTFESAVPGRYFVMLQGREAYEQVKLQALYWVKGNQKPVRVALALNEPSRR